MKNYLHLIVVTCLVGLAGSAALAGEEDDFFRFEHKPRFDATSNDPVLLRYKFKTGQIMKMGIGIDVDMLFRQGGQKFNMKQSMDFDAKASVTEVDSDGNMSVLVKITRFRMKITGLQELSFDSDDENTPEAFKPLMAMINVGIPCRMSPTGELLDTDLEPMRLAMRRAGNAAFAEQMEKSTDKMFEGAFVYLSKEPIRAGESYKAGTIVQDQSKVHMSYKIQSVSADGHKAIMEPVAKIEMNPDAFPGAEVDIKKSRFEGWILHDVEKGYATDAEAKMFMFMEIKADGQSGTAEMKLSTKMKMTVLE